MGPQQWHSRLLGAIEDLGRWYKGRHVLEAGPDDVVVAATSYFDSDFLPGAIADSYHLDADFAFAPSSDPSASANEDNDDIDLRIAVSRFTRHYAAALSSASFVALTHGVALDLSPQNCKIISMGGIPFTLVLGDLPARAVDPSRLPDSWKVDAVEARPAETRRLAWSSLYGHLGTLFDATRATTRVAARLLWTNAAEWVGMTADAADEYLPADVAATYTADRKELLALESLPGVAGPNPLHGLLQWHETDDPMFPNGIHVRLACCLTYRMPDRLGRLCQNCGFLSAEERHALVVERHGVPMGAASGPHEEHARRRGLEMLGLGAGETSP